MKLSNLFYLGAFSALVLTGCKSNDDNSEWMGSDGIVFTSQIEGVTSRVSGASWDENDEVGIFMTTAEEEYSNYKYLAKTDGSLVADGQVLKYPASGESSFIAYYPYTTSLSGKIYAVNVSDQSDPKKIDLLYSNNATGIQPNDQVVLRFQHKLSQIVLNIQKEGDLDINGMAIKVSGMNTTANFDLNDGTLTATDSKADFNMNVQTEGNTGTAEAIVIPAADLTGATLTFTLADGKNFAWTVDSPEADESFKAGTKYIYTATISNTNGQPAVEMGKATIEDWTEQAGGNINVDMGDGEDPQPGEEFVALDESFADGQGEFTIKNVTDPLPSGISYVWNYSSGTSESGAYHYMKASAHVGDVDYATESWLISPAINLTNATTATLTFTHIINYGGGLMSTNQTLWVSEASVEDWEQVTIPNYPNGTSWTAVSSGDIDLSKYAGKTIKLGFKYVSTESSAATWEVYDIKVVGNPGGGTVDPDPDPEPSGSNLLTNPGFEDWTATLPTAWDNKAYNTGEIVKETTIKHEGNNSLRQTSASGTNKVQQEVNIIGGKKYRISYWFLDNDTKASSRYWFAMVGSDGKTINDINAQIQQKDYSTDNAEWQNVVIEFTAPEGTVKMRYEVRTYRNMDSNEAGGYIYYDDMELTEVQ